MKPTTFPEQTCILAKGQEYQPLPVFRDNERFVSCWSFTFWERIKILFGANLWLHQLHCGNLLQPQLPEIRHPFMKKES